MSVASEPVAVPERFASKVVYGFVQLVCAWVAPVVGFFTLSAYTWCSDTGDCFDASHSLADHAWLLGISSAFAVVCVGAPVAIGLRALPHRRRLVWTIALVVAFWLPVSVGIFSLI